MSRRDETVLVECDSVGKESRSGLALSVVIEGEQKWIPLSQVEEVHRDGDPPSIRVAKWFAEKEGLV